MKIEMDSSRFSYSSPENQRILTRSTLDDNSNGSSRHSMKSRDESARTSSAPLDSYGDVPLFKMPTVPYLPRLPEPSPPRPFPHAGYDMRTLRRQIEVLQSVSAIVELNVNPWE